MKINYYPETDSLYIHLADKSSVDSQEISEGVVADYGEFIINQLPLVPLKASA